MELKRIVILSGHYGSGKTNIALNLAYEMKKYREKVMVADIDIVNPYFRTTDSRQELEKAEIQLIASPFASSNVDLPALPQEIYAVVDNKTAGAVIDVGGDDRGALALGRWRDAIVQENDYEMLLVVNFFRPLTRTPEDVTEVMREITLAAGMNFTAIVNNSNLGPETTPEMVLETGEKIQKLCEITGLPLKMTCVQENLYPALQGKTENLFPLRLQKKMI